MLLSISSQPSRRKAHPKRTLHLRCDVCGREFTKLYFTHIAEAAHHTCSVTCQAQSQLKGCILDLKKRQVMIDRYGVENPQQLDWVREKTCRTNVERYGQTVGSKSDLVKARTRQTNLQKFGVEWYPQSSTWSTKTRESCLIRYGVDHPMKASEVKAKYDFKDIWRRAHETKKLNGTYATSRVENQFFDRLKSLFENVERQSIVMHESKIWSVDFKVGDVYVQFDGAYWHGLDRPLEMIKESDGLRDHAIYQRFNSDRQQDKWFKDHGLKLVRITDVQAKTLSDEELKQLLTA